MSSPEIDLSLPWQHELLENAQHPSASPVDVAFTVAKIIDSNANVDRARDILERLSQSVSERTPSALVESLREHGFVGATRRYMELENSRLDIVLERKTGIPITLGMVIIGVAEHLNIESYGINFPSHYLVAVEGTYIDPFKMEVMSIEEPKRWAVKNKIDPKMLFTRSSNKDIAVRMLNNVAESVRRSRNFSLGLQIYDYLELLMPERFDLPLERAAIWTFLGDTSMVREELIKAKGLVKDPKVKEKITKRLDGLSEVSPTSFN